MVELIILDKGGTITRQDTNECLLRDGVEEFLDYYNDKFIVISSDEEDTSLRQSINNLGLAGKFEGLYGSRFLRHMISPNNRYHSDIKNLGIILHDFSADPSDAVFIGDNNRCMDRNSADEYGIKFIQVPQFRSNLPHYPEQSDNEGIIIYETPSTPFSFASLIGKL
ncbi:MAG: HAD family hydrolase [bacterium]|nr:HAD family hydrolase [bacterium]